jgi:molybdopterin/thiamine biosynthesis adenylyltransferase/molybdopterin synthase catalytic subunit/rhodanese-related sulfurtransferase
MSLARFRFSSSALDPASLRSELADPTCGGYTAFEGWVRNHNEGREVRHLEYEAFAELAVREGERIIAEACERFAVDNARCVHRVGDLALGELAVWVGVSARHRDEAFKACRYIIDEVKHRVPIWKKEHYVDGDSGWVNCERCATTPAHADHEHAHHAHAHHAHEHRAYEHHGHAHHGHEPHRSPTHHTSVETPRVPDYSRQMNLREVGAAGQARLRAARIAVVGAGGLGVPVLQYLAGAGIGRLTLVDGDRLEPSNLHRQTWYALADCGTPKADLAAARVRALNPDVDVHVHVGRLDIENGAALLAHHDLIIDCTDNFATKFLINDLAQSLGVPAVFASVHQYEGQLQVVDPTRRSACLRCLWPDATRDGVVGNCAEAGVLGPVPGVLGGLQALEALKIVLGLPGRLGDELLTVDLVGLSTTRLRARRNVACEGRCEPSTLALQRADQERRDALSTPLELEFDDLQSALAEGYSLVDIREPKEIDETPLEASALPVPMGELLAGRNLPPEGRYLLICARGARSLGTARSLRDRGLENVYSLKGGALGLPERQGRT